VAEGSSSNPLTLSLGGGTATSVLVTSGPSNGSTSVTGTTIFYTPTGGFSGSDSLTYTASNGAGTCTAATASITVNFVFTPVNQTFNSGSGTATVPAGASNMVIAMWGGGSGASTAGGCGAGYSARSIAVTGGNTLAYAVGAAGSAGIQGLVQPTAGANSTLSGTVSGGSVSMTAGGAPAPNYTPSVCTGGTASGGTTNTPGSAGALPAAGVGGNGGNANGPGGGLGGAGVASAPANSGSPPGGGGGGNDGASSAAGSGGAGSISLSYTWLILQAPVWAANDNEAQRAAA
jgi:hypothetical protein